jgi:hypothetical protein
VRIVLRKTRRLLKRRRRGEWGSGKTRKTGEKNKLNILPSAFKN